MNKKIIWGIVVVIIIILAIWAGRTTTEYKVGLLPAQTIKIGVVSALTGPVAYIGESNMKGAEVGKMRALKEHPGLIINMFHEDSMFSPKVGIDAYNKLKQTQDINALITMASNVSMAIAPLAVKDNILYIAASTLAADFTTPNDLSFRVTPKADAEVIPAISYFESKKISRVGILYMNNEIGTSLKNALVGAVKNSSVKIVAEEVFAADSVDFRTTLLKLKNAGIDGLYLGALASHTSVILKQANDIKMTVPMVSYRAAEDTVLLKNAGTLANGLLYTNTYDSANQDSENKKFVALYKEKYQEEPNAYAAEAYEAVRLIADTYVKCGDTIKSVEAQECSKAFLFSVKNRSSVFGPLSFDMNGDVTYPFFMKTIKDGKFVRYEGQ